MPPQDELLILDLETGAARTVYAGDACAPCPLPDGVAFVVVDGSQSRVVKIAADGTERWTKVAPHPVEGLITWRDQIVFAAPDEVLALHAASGEPVWRATSAGFGSAAPLEARFSSRPMVVDESRLIIGAEGRQGRGWLVLNPDAGSVKPLRAPDEGAVVDDVMSTISRINSRPHSLVSRHMATICLTPLDGGPVKHLPLPTPPVAFATDATGAVAAAFSHSAGYHDRYQWHDEGRPLEGQCGVTVIEAAGHPRWTWATPGPAAGLAVNGDGRILVTSCGQLLAIG